MSIREDNTKRYAIFGAGVEGEKFFRLVGKSKVAFFIDNYRFGQMIDGKDVYNLSQAASIDLSNIEVIIATTKPEYIYEMQKLLDKHQMDYKIVRDVIREYYPDEWLHFEGDFANWNDACERIQSIEKYKDGYASRNLVENVRKSIMKVRNGEAAFERDGVVFFEEEYNYQFLSAFMYSANQIYKETGLKKLKVLDFGGSLGSLFFQHRRLFDTMSIDWNIVEQLSYYQVGIREVPEICFYKSIDDYINEKGHIDVLIVSSVIQYLPDSYDLLDKLLNSGFRYMIYDRSNFNTVDDEDRIVIQYVPSYINCGAYACRLMSRTLFERHISQSNCKTLYKWIYKDDTYVELLNGKNKVIKIPFEGMLIINSDT